MYDTEKMYLGTISKNLACRVVETLVFISYSTTIVLSQTAQWVFLGLDDQEVSTIIVNPYDPSIVYAGTRSDFSAGTRGSVFKSINAGSSWDTLLYGVDVAQLAISPEDTEIMYAALAGANFSPPGVIKTLDGGDTWFKADSGIYVDWETSVVPITIDPKHPDTVYAGTGGFFGGTLYRTVNAGLFWEDIGEDILDNNIRTVAVDWRDARTLFVGTIGINQIFKTVDFGENWDVVGEWEKSGGVKAVVIDNATPTTVYAGIYQFGLMKSTNGASTWVESGHGLTEDRINAIVQSPANSDEIYVGTYEDGVFRSKNGGSTWEEMNSGLTNSWVVSLAISSTGDEVYCGTYDGIHKASIGLSVRESNDDRHNSSTVALDQNFPNPFNDETLIKYEIDRVSNVSIYIYDISGKRVMTLVDEFKTPGLHLISWSGKDRDGKKLSSGIYLCQLSMGSQKQTRKVVLLR